MTAPAFDRDAIRSFRFLRCEFDATSGVARLVYAFDEGTELVETITVPGAPFVLDDARRHAAEQALRLLHLIAGVSYYKAAVAPEIRIEAYAIEAETAALLQDIYVNGLGEFAYRNGLDLHGRIRFPVAQGGGGTTPALCLREHALVRSVAARTRLVSIEALPPSGRTDVSWIVSQLIRPAPNVRLADLT